MPLSIVVPCVSCATPHRVDLERRADGPRCTRCRTPLVTDAPVPVTDASFDAVIAGAGVPVLVDFYADWCGPCRAMAPAFAALAQRQAGRALVLKVDTDANPALSQRFGIRSIPTLIAFRDGREVARQVGAVGMGAMEQMLGR